MPKKARPKKKADAETELWVRPNLSLKGESGDRAWGDRPGGAPNSSRILELADIALGLKKPAPKKKKTPFNRDSLAKYEPYSRRS